MDGIFAPNRNGTPRWPTCPVIAISAAGKLFDADHSLRKPIKIEALLTLLDHSSARSVDARNGLEVDSSNDTTMFRLVLPRECPPPPCMCRGVTHRFQRGHE